MAERFAAPRGTKVTVITILTLAILAGVTVLLARVVPGAGPGWLLPLLVFGLVALVGVTGLFTVRGYDIDGRTLTIRRLLWGTDIDLEGLRSVEHDPAALRWSLRLLGNDGLFAITGWFRNRKLGLFRAFVSAPRYAVVLRFDDRTLVISPEDPERFVRLMRDRYFLHD